MISIRGRFFWAEAKCFEPPFRRATRPPESLRLRTGKTVNGAKSEYLYLNGLLSEEIRDGHRIHYSYDSYGHLAAIQYYFEDNQTFALYYVTTNAQGDVLGLYTGAGVQVASYEYDAWGNVISMTDTTSFGIATINPIRYRGYYFDEDTGWYYLQSRYYDPEIGRFINADKYVSTGHSTNGFNMYSYCYNNSVIFEDCSGEIGILAVLGILVITTLVISIPSSKDKTAEEKKLAQEKYNPDTISFSQDIPAEDSDQLNVTFYPGANLIHIEDSYAIKSQAEKEVIIDCIMDSDYYYPELYGNSKKTMLIEWSAHNFVYNTASSSDIIYNFYVWYGYDDPIGSTKGVDFRQELFPSQKWWYWIVTMGGLIQW